MFHQTPVIGSPATVGAHATVRSWLRLRWLIVAAVVLVVAGALLKPLLFPPVPRIQTSLLVEEIRSAAKLTTVEVFATVVTSRDESTWYGAKFLFMVIPGKAAVGVDLEAVGPDAIQRTGDALTITLPKPKVLSIDIDLAKVEIYNATGLFRTQFTPQETTALTAGAREKIRGKAETDEVLARAETQTADVIRRLAMAAGAKKAEVHFGP